MRINILIGFLTGLSATIAGAILYISFFAESGILSTIKDAIQNNYLGKIIALGAMLNFLPFFIFIKRNLVYKARGVLLATLSVAIGIAIFKILQA